LSFNVLNELDTDLKEVGKKFPEAGVTLEYLHVKKK